LDLNTFRDLRERLTDEFDADLAEDSTHFAIYGNACRIYFLAGHGGYYAAIAQACSVAEAHE